MYRRRVEELEAEKTRLSQLNMDMNNELFDLKACSAASATEAKVEARKEIEKVQSESKLRERDLERLTKENQSLLRQLSTLKQPPTAPSSSSSSSNGVNGGFHGMNNGSNGASNALRLSGGGAGDSRNEGRLSARSHDSNGSNGIRSASPRNAVNNNNGSGNNSARSTNSRHSSGNDGGGSGGGGVNDAHGSMAATTAATAMSVRDEDSLVALQSVMHMAPGHGLAVAPQSVASVGGSGGSSGGGSGGGIDRTNGSAAMINNTSLPPPPLPAGASSSSSNISIINRHPQASHGTNIPTSSTSTSTAKPISKGYCVANGSLIAALLPLYQRLLIRPHSLSNRQHTPITQALETLQRSFNDMVIQMTLVTNNRSIGGSESTVHHHHGIYGEMGTGEGNKKSDSSSSGSSSSSSSGGSVVGMRASRRRDVTLMVSLQLISLTGSAVALTQAVINHQQEQHAHQYTQSQSHSRYDQKQRGNLSYHENSIDASPSPPTGDGDNHNDNDGDNDDDDSLHDIPIPLTDEHLQYLHDCLVLVHAVTEYLDIEAIHLLIDARLVSKESRT